MAYLDFMSAIHKSTPRDYLARVNEYPKAEAAKLAKQWGYDYWDGDRRICYGGHKYMPGRWRPVADALAAHYRLGPGSRVLDVGCGKAFLLHELALAVPGVIVRGLDISSYAAANAKDEVRASIDTASCTALPYEDKSFDLVVSINTLHNLHCYDLERALTEIERVGRQKYICVESYRTEEEKANLLYWQVTCEAFNTPDEWHWWFDHSRYTGDHSFIFFE
ncbi:MAG: class I SAM-dependent methyltransferase [Deltaproteobacteria bacterium]|nr:class I SAM-dependent methyltransferase [Deltaproteobacteria bacterium]